MVDAISLSLIIASLIVIIGFLANYVFNKTGIPDMLVLILIGAIFGPILGVFDPVAIKSFAPYIAALALAYILFDGGMGLNIHKALANGPRAILLAVLGFVFSVIGVAAFTILVFSVPVLYGLLFGSVFGGSSSIVVISLASKIKISEKGSTVLILESAITDILCIVASLSIINVLVTGQADYAAIGFSITGKFLIGLAVGLALGFTWLFALKKVVPLPFSYILTLGIILLGYAISESLGGSGALSALFFGLILGNESEIFKAFRRTDEENGKVVCVVSKGLKRFESEIAFLIRTFFFVFLGIIGSLSNPVYLISGIALSGILLATRFGAVWLSTAKSSLTKDRKIMTAVLTRGLAAAVLATLPVQYGLLYSDIFVDTAVVVIVTTAIIATIGSMLISRKKQAPSIEEITSTPIITPLKKDRK